MGCTLHSLLLGILFFSHEFWLLILFWSIMHSMRLGLQNLIRFPSNMHPFQEQVLLCMGFSS